MGEELMLTPGAPRAVDAGCICPRMDNAHGVGYLGGVKDEQGKTVYVIRDGCPLHDERVAKRAP